MNRSEWVQWWRTDQGFPQNEGAYLIMLTILVGLPGSGKSTFAKSEASKKPGTRVYEDFLGARKPLDPGTGLFSLLTAVQKGETIFADDIFLCREDYRGTFEKLLAPFLPPHYSVRWVYFSNSPEVCKRNVEERHRNNPDEKRRKHSLEWIEKLPPIYVIPQGVHPIPVVDHGV